MMRDTGPSDEVLKLLRGTFSRDTIGLICDAVTMAHDRKIGLDRSVCLRDVVEALRAQWKDCGHQSADFIEREFTEGS